MPTQSNHFQGRESLLRDRRRFVLLGSRGSGMTALHEILRDAGHSVVGMDKAANSMPFGADSEGKICLPWDPLQTPEADICVCSPAVKADDPVMQKIQAGQIPVFSLPAMLNEIFREKQQICVAGTHGKSTTTSMLTWLLEQTGHSPSCYVGAHQSTLQTSGRYCESPHAVIESCEFSNSFHNFQPTIAVLTGIERDHFDCFPDQNSEDEAFAGFLLRITADGALVFDTNDERSVRQAVRCDRRQITFGMGSRSVADFICDNVFQQGTETRAEIRHKRDANHLRLNIPGRHNLKNALAAVAGAAAIGISPEQSCAALAEFRGLSRRFEFRGDYDGITLIDDYAHHPSAIKATLSAARETFPGQRLIVAVEPHQAGRTRKLFPDFISALSIADEILILPVFPARESDSPLECCRLSGRLVRELNAVGSKAFLFANLDQIVSRVDHSAKATDIFVTMGAGRTNLIHDELTRRLQRHSVA